VTPSHVVKGKRDSRCINTYLKTGYSSDSHLDGVVARVGEHAVVAPVGHRRGLRLEGVDDGLGATRTQVPQPHVPGPHMIHNDSGRRENNEGRFIALFRRSNDRFYTLNPQKIYSGCF
jgi:hypothetical protein